MRMGACDTTLHWIRSRPCVLLGTFGTLEAKATAKGPPQLWTLLNIRRNHLLKSSSRPTMASKEVRHTPSMARKG